MMVAAERSVRFLTDQARKRDPEKRGINFLVNQNIGSGTSTAAATLGPSGKPLPTGQRRAGGYKFHRHQPQIAPH